MSEQREHALKIAADLLSWSTDDEDNEVDELLRKAAICLREQADLNDRRLQDVRNRDRDIEQLEAEIRQIEKVTDFNADRVVELEKNIKNALECQAHAHNAIQRMPDNPYGRFYRWSDIRLALRVGERLSDD